MFYMTSFSSYFLQLNSWAGDSMKQGSFYGRVWFLTKTQCNYHTAMSDVVSLKGKQYRKQLISFLLHVLKR